MAAASIAHAHDPVRVTVGVDTHKDTHVGHAKDMLVSGGFKVENADFRGSRPDPHWRR